MRNSEFTTNIRNPNQVDPAEKSETSVCEGFQTEGNGFVHRQRNEQNPDFSDVTPIEETYSDGSNFKVTPEPEPTSVKAVASAEEVRIYRINPDGKRFHILTEPSYTPETDTFCQTHANTTQCLVEMHDAMSCRIFEPLNPPQRPTDPPISDRVKDVAETAVSDLTILTILIAVFWAAIVVL